MRWCVVIMAMAVMSCAAKTPPAQPTPTEWNVPYGLKTCQIWEATHRSDGWTVTLFCPNGTYLVDYHAKRVGNK